MQIETSREFFQTPPELGNQFNDDDSLQNYLKWTLPSKVLSEIKPSLEKLGERARTDLFAFAQDAEKNEPVLVNYNAWGERIDEIITAQGWKDLEKAAAVEGIVASGYERKYGSDSRVYQAALLYIYHPSSAIFSCPLAMTDGAARVMELFASPELKSEVFGHLTSRDPKKFWTSGQWMTERTGGSDVSGTTTIAKRTADGFELHGTKFFTSAATSQMAMTLARIEGAEPGNRGLSLFFLRTRDNNGKLNRIQINRLKNKLGTKALPTAELTMIGTPATLLGEEGRGVKNIANLFNVTRLYNSVCALGYMRRAYALAFDYAHKREAFGKKLIDHPLHSATLNEMHDEIALNLFFTFNMMKLQGLEDLGEATEQDKNLLRILTPVLKLSTGKKAIALVSEALECFGGQGYMEDTGIPVILRDTQALTIWEGTTNILSLDVLRSMRKDDSFSAFAKDVSARLEKTIASELQEFKNIISLKLKSMIELTNKTQTDEDMQLGARIFAFDLAHVYTASVFLNYACDVSGPEKIIALRQLRLAVSRIQ